MKLGVNIDHIATLREARKINEPDPLEAIYILKNAGASQVTIHLREDRRHIHDSDVEAIIRHSILPVNVESSVNKEIVEFLLKLEPHSITLVPENREEITTEGGLLIDKAVIDTVKKIKDKGIKTSLFIDQSEISLNLANKSGADAIELHTGEFANLFLALNTNINHTHNKFNFKVTQESYHNALERIKVRAKEARDLGMEVYAGHGLNYQNIFEIKAINEITELNIGHSIIARAVFIGLYSAVKDMVELLK